MTRKCSVTVLSFAAFFFYTRLKSMDRKVYIYIEMEQRPVARFLRYPMPASLGFSSNFYLIERRKGKNV